MINLLKMDFHRFFTNKMMYILLLVFIAFQIFGIFMLKQYEEPIPGEMLMSSMNASQFTQVMIAQTPSWVLMYITVFSVYFYMSEYNAGFYKNYISMEFARTHSVLSKVIILGLFTLLMFISMMIADLIGRGIFFGHTTIGDGGYFVKLMLGLFLLHWAFSIVVMFITMLVKNMIPSIVIGVGLVLNVQGMLLGALESLISDTNINSYMLVNTIVQIKDFSNMGDIIHVVSVAIIFIIIFTFISIRYKIKEDLR